MAIKKLFCVLEQSCYEDFELSKYHKQIFTKDFCDFYRLNWKIKDKMSNFFEKNITKSEGLSLLDKKIPKNYEYYIFMDDDVIFKSGQKIKINKKDYFDASYLIKNFLEKYNPLVGSLFRKNSGYCNCVKTDKEYYNYLGQDSDLLIMHKSVANELLPITFHSSVKYFNFVNYLCHILYPEKQIRANNIEYENTRHIFSNSYQFKNKYSFSQSGLYILSKYNSLLYNQDNIFIKIRYNKSDYILKNIKISKKIVPSKKKIFFRKKDLERVLNTNNIEFKNRSAISFYNNRNEKIKNRLLCNERNYIFFHSLIDTNEIYNSLLKNNQKDFYILKLHNKKDHKLFIEAKNTINENFIINCFTIINENNIKENKNWYNGLYNLFNINEKYNFDFNDKYKIFKHKNLRLYLINNNVLNSVFIKNLVSNIHK